MLRQNPCGGTTTLCLTTVWMVLSGLFHFTLAFTPLDSASITTRSLSRRQQPYSSSSTALPYSHDKDGSSSSSSPPWDLLQQRVQHLRLEILEQELARPPSAALSATEFVQELLLGLQQADDPTPEAGFRLLLRTATPEWKAALYASVGAPCGAPEHVVASALGEAMGRPDNQYALLVSASDDDDDNDNKTTLSPPQTRQEYVPTFPFEPLDYFDGTAWVECRLRDKHDDTLLVSTGWHLRRRSDGAWMVAGMDWQDFRDNFRPGIGREEWMRICS